MRWFFQHVMSRRAHGSEPASMQCGGPVASPGTAMSRRSKIKQEVICGKSHRVLHTQQLPQEGRTDASGTTRESDRVRVVEKEIGLSRKVIVRRDGLVLFEEKQPSRKG